MGPEVPGQLAIWLALVLIILSGCAFFASARGRHSYISLAHRAYYAFTAFTALAVIDLFYLLFTHNYAFKYVYDYSERSQPFFYIVAAFWGGQEGTYLLWLMLTALCGFLILRRGGQYRNYAMVFFSMVNLFFLFLLVKVSPFALLPVAQADGMGLNPLLRDPWMVIHPPVMFTGYAMCAVPFALAMAAMAKNDYTDWVKRVFPWVAAVAFLLALGNILGGYWAYKTLGWGGYWAWDPVENSSWVPWITSVALVHGLLIERRTGALRKINLLLSAYLFLLVVYGTFLTRSGVLADFSVHSFTDLGISANLIGFMGGFFVLTLVMFFYRLKSIKSAPLDYNYFGKEFTLVASVAVMFVFGLIVLFWSSLPILSGWFSDEPRAAEIVTYNSFAIPLSIIMAFLVTAVPIAKFGGYRLENGPKKAAVILLVCALIGFGLFYLVLDAGLVFAVMFTLIVSGILVYLYNPEFRKPLIPALLLFLVTILVALLAGVTDYLILLFYATAAMAALSNLIYLAGYFPKKIKSIGAPLTHFGFGMMLIGVMASSAFDSSDRITIAQGQTSESEKFGVTVGYNGMAHDIEFPTNELLMTLDDGSGPDEVRPQLYYSRRMDGIMRKPYISRSLGYDLYLAPLQVQESEGFDGLMLRKGQTRRAEGLTFNFLNFEISSHDEAGEGEMSVVAIIEVSDDKDTATIMPTLVSGTDEHGHSAMTSDPTELNIGDRQYQVTIAQIQADQGVVVLDIPEFLPESEPAKLILDISKKPLISLVWVGTTLMLLGLLVSVYRRRSDVVQADA